MESDITTPIEYNPQLDEVQPHREESEPQQYYYAPHPMILPPMQQPEVKKDFLTSLDKTAYLVIFAAFILGFFMGKTMQPVILRHG